MRKQKPQGLGNVNPDKTIKELFEDAEQFEHYQDPKQVKRNKAKLARLNQKIQERDNGKPC